MSLALGSHQAPVRVAACAGKHLFHRIHDPRVIVHPLAGPGSEDAELIVIPCATTQALGRALRLELPPALRSRAASGGLGVVFDASSEGVEHTAALSALLHAVLARLGVSPLAAVYITQDRGFEAAYRAHGANTEVREPIAVICYDLWIARFFRQFGSGDEQPYLNRLEAFRRRPQRHARRHRGEELDPLGLAGFESLADELRPLLPILAAKGQVHFGDDTGQTSGGAPIEDDPMPQYSESWFSVVTETEMRGRVSRITEKAFKPLVNFHPVVMFGNPGALAMIRELGFATFDGLIDESYDQEADPRRRFDLAYQQVQRLARMDQAVLAANEAQLAERLAFNARWGITRAPTVERDRRDRALVDEILLAVRRR